MKKPPVVRMARCPRCGHVWSPRVPHPKACPECKARIGWYIRKRMKK